MADSAQPAPGARVGRAALLGLGAGLLLGGGYLLFVAIRNRSAPVNCARLPPAECDLLTQSARELAKMQLLSGIGLVLLALAIFVLLRAWEKRQSWFGES